MLLQTRCRDAVAADRQRPSAEEKRDHQTAVHGHRRIFGEHEKRELHRRVLSVISGHELRLRFRQIEWRAVVLRVHRHEKDERGDDLREEIPDTHFLILDDLHEPERSAEHQHADDRQPERHFIRHHLRGRSQSAHQ